MILRNNIKKLIIFINNIKEINNIGRRELVTSTEESIVY
jgi:hypothetical protein